MNEEQTGQRRSQVVAAVIVGMLVLLVGVSIAGNGSDEDDEVGAWIACREFVERQLRSPASAEFPPRSTADIQHTSDGWEIESYVDADNAMGGTLRSEFTCQTSLDGDTWVGRAQLDER